jgi:hypothetical protein
MNLRPIIGALNGGFDFDKPSYFFSGVIDEVRVWNKVLTEAEVKRNMEGVPGTAVFPESRLATVWGDIKK